MANGVLISSFTYVGAPTLSAIFGFFKTSASVQIQRLQLSAQVPPFNGNVTVQLIDQNGNAYAGASVSLATGTTDYDQPLAAPITLGPNRIVRAQITGVDDGTAANLQLNLMGATAQGSNAPTGCGTTECQPPVPQLLFFKGSVADEQAAAAASAAAAAASATAAAGSATSAATAETNAETAKTNAETAVTNATAQVTAAAAFATNANNAATASSVYASNSQGSASAAAVSATAAAAYAAEAQAGHKAAMLQLTVGSTQTIPDATPTAASWNNTQFDDLGFWDASQPTRLTIPLGSGIQRVRLTAGIRWTASGTGERKIKIRSNPVGMYAANTFWASDDRPTGTTGDATIDTGIITVEEGMYFEVIVEQNSGGGLDLNTAASVDNPANFFSIEVLKRAYP